MSDQTPQEEISVALELADSFSAEEASRKIIDAISAAGYEIVRKRPATGIGPLDLDAMEKRARRQVGMVSERQLTADALALIARVRELDGAVSIMDQAICEIAEALGVDPDSEAILLAVDEIKAAERKRCADAVRAEADEYSNYGKCDFQGHAVAELFLTSAQMNKRITAR